MCGGTLAALREQKRWPSLLVKKIFGVIGSTLVCTTGSKVRVLDILQMVDILNACKK